jgi:Mn2+/Fe2+ NRAMP family transporter
MPKARHPVRRFFAALGPGVITGAADDDPSGIATFSIAGARFGTAFLWTALLTWPLMAAVQMMCARIGMVTGCGLARNLLSRFPRPLLILVALSLLAANSLNIAADLSGMADAAEMLTGLNSHYFVSAFALLIVAATIWLRYQQISSILKWLALILIAYIVTALLLHPHWGEILHDTFIPSLPKTRDFWQTSQEVEEEKALGRTTVGLRRGATDNEIMDRKLDIGFGTFSSNLVMFFVILATALTLHAHGKTEIQSSREAASALEPLAGKAASLLYTVGIFGVGFLAIPTLSSSAAYAISDTFRWRQGLSRKLVRAREFYSIIAISTLLGVVLDFFDVNAIRILFWSAILNGLLSPVLLVGILIVAADPKVMQAQPSSRLSLAVVGLTALLMGAAAVGMLVF